MKNQRAYNARCQQRLQRGYTMIEVSVALVIALFLLNGMVTILQGTRSASQNQSLLAQLQDDQRVAMTMITDVIQQAGYYPSPNTTDPALALPVSPAFATTGQAVAGGSNAYGDTVTVRYQGDASGTVLDCQGAILPNNPAPGIPEEMTFSVRVNPVNPNMKELVCTANGVTATLVRNVQGITVAYGVDVNNSGSANTYLPLAQMTAGLWPNVYSVKITVNFTNPLYGQPGQNGVALQTIAFTRVIGIMSKAGVNVVNLY
jgi:type IV pilus assembly protein PilW